MKKAVFAGLVMLGIAALLFFRSGQVAGPGQVVAAGAAQSTGPEIVLYTGENFTGRAIRVVGTLPDLPKDQEQDGSLYDWNDNVRSLVVVRGTWRIYQHGRCNTRIDDDAVDQLHLSTKLPAVGWSTLVSATSAGQLEVADLASVGVGSDISSVELISTNNLPDWTFAFRK